MWFIGLLSFLALAVGLISIVYPLQFIRIETRGAGVRLVAASLIFFFVGSAVVGPPEERAIPFFMLFLFVLAAGLVSIIYPVRPLYIHSRTIAAQVVSVSLVMLGVCLVNFPRSSTPSTSQQQAAAPEPSKQPVRNDPKAAWAKEVMEAAQRAENEYKAAEATANMRALAAKRELDQAESDARSLRCQAGRYMEAKSV